MSYFRRMSYFRSLPTIAAVTLVMPIGCQACTSNKQPQTPAHGSDRGEVAPPAVEKAKASDAGKSPAAKPPAARAQQYVGLRSPDLLLEAPDPLLPRGERVLDAVSPWGLVALAVEGGNQLLFLDRLTDKGDFIVEAVLELPEDVSAEQVAWENCEADQQLDTRVVATVPAGAGCEPPLAAAELAWRVDPEASRFAPIAAEGIRCRPPTCDEPVDNGIPMGVPGGS